MENYKYNKKFKMILLTLVLFKVIFFILNIVLYLDILFFNINQSTINFIVNILIIIIGMIILNYNIRKAIKYLINFIALIFIVILIFINLMFNSDKSYFYFNAPNKSHTLVVEENSFLLAGRSKFYERKGLIFIKDLNREITTDDGYKPFSNNHYNLKWLENNSVELNYDYGVGSGVYKKTIIKFN